MNNQMPHQAQSLIEVPVINESSAAVKGVSLESLMAAIGAGAEEVQELSQKLENSEISVATEEVSFEPETVDELELHMEEVATIEVEAVTSEETVEDEDFELELEDVVEIDNLSDFDTAVDPTPRPKNPSHQACLELFAKAAEELSHSEDVFEINASHVRSMNREEHELTYLFFDLATEFLNNPDVPEDFDQAVIVSDQREVIHEALDHVLEETEAAVGRSFISLKASDQWKGLKPEEGEFVGVEAEPLLTMPAGKKQLRNALLLDGFLSLIVSALVLLTYLAYCEPYYYERLSSATLTPLDQFLVFSIWLASLPVIVMLTSMVQVCIFHSTFGIHKAGLSIIDARGEYAKFDDLLLRATLLPLSLVVGGFLPAFSGKRCLHDYFCNTWLLVVPETED